MWWNLFFKNSTYWQLLCISDDISICSRNNFIGYYWLLIHANKVATYIKFLYSVIFCFLKSAFTFNLHAYVWCTCNVCVLYEHVCGCFESVEHRFFGTEFTDFCELVDVGAGVSSLLLHRSVQIFSSWVNLWPHVWQSYKN